MKLYKDFGLWREDEVEIKGVKVRPKDVFCKVFGEALSKYEDLDMCAIRAKAVGTKDGKTRRLQIDILDKQCEQTGFTSMERLTGFSIAIHAIAVAEGSMPHGVVRYENALTGEHFVHEIQKRGIHLKFSEEI
jgi:lysine 6-dehydrogenase